VFKKYFFRHEIFERFSPLPDNVEYQIFCRHKLDSFVVREKKREKFCGVNLQKQKSPFDILRHIDDGRVKDEKTIFR